MKGESDESGARDEVLKENLDTVSVKVQHTAGDLVVYPGQGVCTVVQAGMMDNFGAPQSGYVLQPHTDAGRKIFVPVSNVEVVGLRELISEADVVRIFTILGTQAVASDVVAEAKGRIGRIREKVLSRDVFVVAEGLGDLIFLSRHKRLCPSENKFLESTCPAIATEIAAVRGQSIEEVIAQIDAIFHV